jgi:Tol biopolymer transport system component
MKAAKDTALTHDEENTMKRIITAISAIMVIGWTGSAQAEELLLKPEKIISTTAGQIPQAPRISPDGKQIVFEYYTKSKTSLWYATADGKGTYCLTCEGPLASMSLENGFWHQSGNYLLFNEVPEGSLKQRGIYTAVMRNGKLGEFAQVSLGARPQFSHPSGKVIFYETTEKNGDSVNNILAYQILGRDPLKPAEDKSIELRGPIQQVNLSAEISHPSLAPDGTTIVFAARTTNIKSNEQKGIVLNDIDRQKIYKLWKELIRVNKAKINTELQKFGSEGMQITPQIGSQWDLSRDDFESVINNEQLLAQSTIVPGYTKRHLFLAWIVGLLDLLDDEHDTKVQELIFPRLWITDVFGAPVTPLVRDISSTPLPQKWPTVSHDGNFVVFEAGHYSNRHVYLVAKKKEGILEKAAKLVGAKWGEEWMQKAIKITELGTYNSSPELDPTGQWLYFESNRDGSKGIWRAKLNWSEINKQLGL